jgi:hypothetical protein
MNVMPKAWAFLPSAARSALSGSCQWDPPRTLAYTWPGDGGSSEVTFELFPDGGDVLLVLTHTRLADDDTMIMVASGWDTHLGILIDRLEGRDPRGFWSNLRTSQGNLYCPPFRLIRPEEPSWRVLAFSTGRPTPHWRKIP